MFLKYVRLSFILGVFLLLQKANAQDNFFNTSFNYSSNTTTYGRLNSLVKQPSYSPEISFYSKYGFDVSAVFYVLGNSDSTFEESTTEFDINIGYEWEPFKNFLIYPSYSHFFYSKNSYSFKSGFTDNFQLDIDYSIKFFNTGISGNYLFGETNTGIISFRNSILLEKENFLFKNLYVAIQPGVNLTWGNQLYYTDKLEKYLSNNPEVAEDLLNRLKSNRPKFYNWIMLYKQNHPELSIQDLVLLFLPTIYDEDKKFNLNALSFSLPVFFMIGSHLSYMVNLIYYKPINTPDYLDNEWKLFWSTGISYTFN